MQKGTSWLDRLAEGDVDAAERLWQHFFHRLHAYAAVCLRNLPPGMADADDITVSVFRSICRMAGKQAVPSVRDPEQLWPLLATIAARKVARQVRRARPGKPGRQTLESDLAAVGVLPEEVSILSQVMGREPSPELAEAVRDLWAELLRRLNTRERGSGHESTIAELWLAGQSTSQIAAATGVSSRTVARKLAMIRRLIQELSGEPPASGERS